MVGVGRLAIDNIKKKGGRILQLHRLFFVFAQIQLVVFRQDKINSSPF
jgi:hypothetical protein